MQLTEEQKKKQRMRSIAIAWTLAGMAILFFIFTLVRLGANVANRPL
jgi:phage terminase Nu1 subunit (DNA packaging protein)